MAQSTRLVKGVVLDSDNNPLSGATVSDAYNSIVVDKTGKFELSVDMKTRYIKACLVGYEEQTMEIDGSYLIFNLNMDKKYASERAKAEKEAANKAKLEEQQRLETEKQAAKEAESKAKLEEKQRLEAEKQAAKEAESKAKVEEKARLASLSKEERKSEIKALFAKRHSGYGSIVDISYLYSKISNVNDDSINISYIGGYRFNNHIFLGLGVGATMSLGDDVKLLKGEGSALPRGKFNFPAYIHFRYNILNRRCTPFFAVSAGGYYALQRSIQLELKEYQYGGFGILANPQIGVSYRLTPKSSINLAIGFNLYTSSYCETNNGLTPTMSNNLRYALDAHIGFTF